jgi:sialate O-acetylesterase
MRIKIAFFTLAALAPLDAAIQLPALISDNMVLQQQSPVRIWGKADPLEDVTIKFLGRTVSARAGQDGKWQAFLSPVAAGGPYEMEISGSNTITIRNVLVGEVWVASGQSNMAWTVKASKNSEQEIAAASYPNIRFFQVRTTVADHPAEDVAQAVWRAVNPDTAPGISAVAYFFARELQMTRGVPVGILQSAVGGTPAQAWTSRETLDSNKMLHWYLESWEKRVADFPAAKERYDARLVEWKEQAAGAKAQGRQPPRPPQMPAGGPGHPHTPSGLYNGMIAPLTPYAIRGAIWYQGEANAGPTDSELYRHLFAEMILDWRRSWGIGQFPFLFVQLASFAPPADRNWALLRDSQTRTLEIAHTGMALAIDVGESNDIHPKDKQTVGRRLALAARGVAYGENIVYSGPMYRQHTREQGAMRIWFDHTGSGLRSSDGNLLAGFRIAGEDGRFFKAEARIEGSTIVVASALVSDPVAVRYAWENDPVATLVNREGLPAVPFRTDHWK